MLLNFGAKVSIIDATFARKEGCMIDKIRSEECVDVGKNADITVGRTKIKITLDGSLVYYFDV